MTSQALYNRWRSQNFDDVLGQDHITSTLRNQIRAGRIGHAYLFTGLRGTGKTSMARIMAKAVNCIGGTDNPPCNVCHMCTSITAGRSLDLMEIDAASNRGIDEIRDLRERVGFVPHEARFKVYVIDEVHMLTKEASNALLKTLEEPPAHVIFVLCTTEPHRLLDTILSRCQRFDFRRASVPVLLTKLQHICAGEGLDVSPAALEHIARRASGSFRDAESLLEHIAAHASGGIDIDLVQHLLGAVPTELVTSLIAAMLSGDAATGLRLINDALDQGADPRQFIGEVLDQLRGLLLLSVGSDDALTFLGPGTIEALSRLVTTDGFSAQFLLQAIRSFNDAAQGLRNAVRTQLPLELALVETIVAIHPDGTSEQGARTAVATRHALKAAQAPHAVLTPARAAVEPSVAVDTAVCAHSETAGPAEPSGVSAVGSDPRAVAAVESTRGEQALVVDSSADTRLPAETLTAQPARIAEDGDAGGPADPEPRPSDSLDSDVGVAAAPATRPISLEWAQGKWSQIISRMGAVDRKLQAALRGTYPIRATGDLLVLGCESAFHRDTLSDPKRFLAVEQVISDALESPCRIQCIVDKEQVERMRASTPPDESLFTRVDRRAQREQELLNHPAVKALEQRGGHVTRVDLADDESE